MCADRPRCSVQARVVEAVWRRNAPVTAVVIGGYEPRLTGEHPFYTLGRGWAPAFGSEKGPRVF